MPRRASSNKLRSMETLEARNLLAADCGPGDDMVAMVSPSVESSAIFADEVVASPQRVSAARIGFGSLFGSSRDNSIGNANNLGTLDRDRSASGSIGGFDSLDFFRFDVSNQVQLDLTLANRAFGTRLSLFDQSGNLLKNDTGNSNLQIHTTLNRGAYYVGVGNWSFFSSRYELDLEVSRPQPTVRDAVGDTLRSAYDLGAVTGTRRVQEAVGAGDRADVFRFDIDRTSSVNLSLSKLAADADLSLLDSRGNVLSKSDRAGNAAESIRGRLPSGSYFVSITPYRNASSRYEFSITATPQVPTTPPARPTPVAPRPETPAPTEPTPSAPDQTQPLQPVSNFGGVNDWNLNHVNAPESWAAGYTGQGTIVAVVDTGVDLQHIDLGENLWVNVDDVPNDGIDNDRNGYVDDVYGWNFAGNNNNPDDRNGHGTHVAGTIAAERNGQGATGVAYNATIMPVKVLGDNGSGSDYAVARGIRYAVDNDADIINLSLGGTGNSRTIRSALEYALQNDVFVVIASGNDGAAIPSYPAIHSRDLGNVISVGAATQQGSKASFSNRVGSSQAVQVDAPGVGIYSTLPNNRYGRLSGTSMAAPHVAGVAALTLSSQPNLTSANLKNLLSTGAEQGVRGSDSQGTINAATSVAYAQSASLVAASQSSHSNARRSGYVFRTVDLVGPSLEDRDVASAIVGWSVEPIRSLEIAEPASKLVPQSTQKRPVDLSADGKWTRASFV